MLTFKNGLAYYKGFCFGAYQKTITDDNQEKWFVSYKEIVEFQTGDIDQNHIHLNIDKTEIQVQRFLNIKFANWQEFWK